ncbi:MAG: glycosyltransferase [Acidobacteriota bacterium]
MHSPFSPIKVIAIDLKNRLTDLEPLADYETAQALVRSDGEPLGYATLPAQHLQNADALMNEAILARYSAVIAHRLIGGDRSSMAAAWSAVHNLVDSQIAIQNKSIISVTVAICTRDRAVDLARCLDSIRALDYPVLEVLVVDNAPSSDATEQLVRSTYPDVRYVCELRPGLNWARNRAIEEARGDIIAYTDDDVVVDAKWINALARIFSENREVMAVTGLVAPFELETEAQVLFEKYGGFGRGFKRQWYGIDPQSNTRVASLYAGAGMFGTGANMAYRRNVFKQIGNFDPALDVGTVTNGGGDLEMFFRILKAGHTLVYEPSAIVYHRHRRDYAQLRTQITNNGIGLYAFLLRSALAYPEERLAFLKFAIWWLWWWNLRRLLISFKDPERFPRALILAELRGSFSGLLRYRKSKRNARKIAQSFRPA